MADVAGVQNESRRGGQGIDLVDRCLQGTYDVGVCRFVEAHVAVADLDEGKVALGCMFFELGKATQAVGAEDSAFDHAKSACSRPSHALQEAAAVNSVVV